MSELIKYLAEIGAKAQEWDKVCKFGQSLLFPAGDAAYDSENETPADAVCRLLQELADCRKKAAFANWTQQEAVDWFRAKMAKEGISVGEVNFAEPQADGDSGITPEVTSALNAAAESFYDLRALLERLHLLTAEATDHTAEIRIRDILNKYAVSLPHKHQAYRPFEEPSSKV